MLKVYLNELRKVKRQKTVRMIMLVGVLIAVCVGSPEQTVYTKLRRLRKKIKKFLKAE